MKYEENSYYLISVISNISSANRNFYYQKYSKYFDEIYQEHDQNESTERNIKEKVLLKKINTGYKLAVIRGATTSTGNTVNEIENAVIELIEELISRNNLKLETLLSNPESITYQFERLGYFKKDDIFSSNGNNVFIRVVSLRDSWARMMKQTSGQ